MKRVKKILAVIALISVFVLSPEVLALELEIVDNGGGSTNEVQIVEESEVVVTQENEAVIENNIQTEADTGENQASDNTGGDVSITTGDAGVVLNVDNTANVNEATHECCEDPGTITISGNGADSTNTANVTTSNVVAATSIQTANITNNVGNFSNTGNNQANRNNGNVTIDTGSAYVSGRVVNGPVNAYSATISVPTGTPDVLISGNGDGSKNIVNIDSSFYYPIINFSNAIIKNNLVCNANSGDNSADRNLGDVAVITGDAYVDCVVENGPINISKIVIDCCGTDPTDPTDPVDPTDPTDPTDPSDPGDPGTGGNGGNGGSAQGASSSPGPAVLGLSNTSSFDKRSLLFLLGVIIVNLGVRLFGKVEDENTIKKAS